AHTEELLLFGPVVALHLRGHRHAPCEFQLEHGVLGSERLALLGASLLGVNRSGEPRPSPYECRLRGGGTSVRVGVRRCDLRERGLEVARPRRGFERRYALSSAREQPCRRLVLASARDDLLRGPVLLLEGGAVIVLERRELAVEGRTLRLELVDAAECVA